MPEKKKVLFIVPYPLHRAPSQRFRVELFLPFLKQAGIDFTVLPFLDDHTYLVLYSHSSLLKKIGGVVKGFLRRIMALVRIHQYDYIFIHREASPLGPPFFEFFAAKVFRKKIIYDFDDAIWIADSKNKILNWLKAYWKIKFICSWAYKVVGGNEFLCSYAGKFNGNVVLIPTCVDTENVHNRVKDQEDQPMTIGWTGSHSTLRYLDPIVPVLKSFAENFGVRTVIICNKPPQFSFQGLQYVPWKEASEINDLLQIHIGIMPLQNDIWSEGKCGFKLIQYLSLGIPAVASPVGVNKQIIEQGVNGYLCTEVADWEKALSGLLTDIRRREEMGINGRKKIVQSYSMTAYKNGFLKLFT
jgi:glycosyltransferase involved in cell wall biosynthesis